MISAIRTVAEIALHALPRRTQSRDALILAYHNVVDPNQSVAGDRSLHLPADAFERQLKLIRANADVLSLSELLDFQRQAQTSTNRVVAITFDDAYASAMQLGLSICDAHRVPATIFVAPNLLGSIPPWDYLAHQGQWSESEREGFLWESKGRLPGNVELTSLADSVSSPMRIATEQMLLKALVGTNHSVGNHTLDHVNLGAIETTEAQRQIEQASIWLDSRFPDRNIPVLSYPYGIAPMDPELAVRPADIRFACRVDGGWFGGVRSPEPLATPRWNVPAGISYRGFGLRLRGWLTNR